MSKDLVKAIANVSGGWACAWCWVGSRYQPYSAGAFEVVTNYYLDCCDALEKAAEMCDQPLDEGDGYFSEEHWPCGNIDVYKCNGDRITMIVNKCRVIFSGDKHQARAIVKATRKASEVFDKE